MQTKPTALVIGQGLSAEAAACRLAEAGMTVVSTATAPLRVDGGPGRFDIVLADRPGVVAQRVDTVILADRIGVAAAANPYGLVPGPGVVALEQAAGWIGRPRESVPEAAGVRQALILHGFGEAGYPAVLGEVLDLALTLQHDWRVQTFVLTSHLKVAGHGLEALQARAKACGVMVFKLTDEMPTIAQEAGKVAIGFADVVSGQRFTLRPDLVIFDEDLAPSAATAGAATVCRLDRSTAGFAQADNVHRLAVATNRAGIFAIGGSRAVLDPVAQTADGALAALASLHTLTAPGLAATALIDRGACVRCLTCYRLCPHRAIVLEPRPLILAQACAGCGLCMAQCPAQAISLDGIGPAQMAQRSFAALPERGSAPVVVLGCRRSAEAAWQLALDQGWQVPEGVCFTGLPCAGSVSSALILQAFAAGAGGVLVLACHQGNCYSQNGSANARDQVGHLTAVLSAIGVAPQRLDHFTLAANMERRLIQGVEAFAETIRRLGPTGFRPLVEESEHERC